MAATTKTYISRVENKRLIFADLLGADLLGITSKLNPTTKTGSKLTVTASMLPPAIRFFREPLDIWISGANSTTA